MCSSRGADDCFSSLSKIFYEYSRMRKEFKSVSLRYYDMSELGLRLGTITAVYCISDPDAFANSVPATEMAERLKLFFVVAEGTKPKSLREPAVFVSKDDILSQKSKESVILLILKALQEQCPINVLSPYETAGVVFGDRFFGRSTEVDTLMAHTDTNYVVFGSRRIGKTSLLHHLKHLYKRKLSEHASDGNSGMARYISCLGISTLKEFQDIVLTHVDPRAYWKGEVFKDMAHRRQSASVYLRSYFRVLAKRYKHGIILLLDEVDSMVESPEFEAIAQYMKLLADDRFRFIQAGYRGVWREMHNVDSEYWNFCQGMKLAQFTRAESFDLIEKPMSGMGIKLASGISQQIYEETGGIPNYIQQYCHTIVLEARRTRNRKVTRDVFGMIHSSDGFDNIVMLTINQNFREPLERFTAFVVANEDLDKVSTGQIVRFCHALGGTAVDYDMVRATMNMLTMMGLMQPVGEDLYRFIAPIIGRQLRRRNLDALIQHEVEALKAKAHGKESTHLEGD